jgi:hypothetical protein
MELPMHLHTDVTLVPLNSLFDRRYAVYWRVERGAQS